MDRITWSEFIDDIAIVIMLSIAIIALSVFIINVQAIDETVDIQTYTIEVEVLDKEYAFYSNYKGFERTVYYLELAGSGHAVGSIRVPETLYFNYSIGDTVEVGVTEELQTDGSVNYSYKIL